MSIMIGLYLAAAKSLYPLCNVPYTYIRYSAYMHKLTNYDNHNISLE